MRDAQAWRYGADEVRAELEKDAREWEEGMSKFGWSYPPGCSGTPYDEEPRPCDACGLHSDEDGRPACVDPVACDRKRREQAEAEAACYAEMEKAEKEYEDYLSRQAAHDIDDDHKYGGIEWAD